MRKVMYGNGLFTYNDIKDLPFPRTMSSWWKLLPPMKWKQGRSTLRKPSSPVIVIPLSASRRSPLRRKPLSTPSPIKIGDGFLPGARPHVPSGRAPKIHYNTGRPLLSSENLHKDQLNKIP